MAKKCCYTGNKSVFNINNKINLIVCLTFRSWGKRSLKLYKLNKTNIIKEQNLDGCKTCNVCLLPLCL